MANPLERVRYHFSLQSAIDEGFAYERKRPIELSEERKRELMESSSLETPRSNMRSIFGVLKPYITQSSPKEKLFAATLMGGSLYLNYFSVDMMADFGNWLGTMTNTVSQLWQIVASSRPEMIADIVQDYPLFQDALQNMPLLNEMLLYYPDVSQIGYDPQFREMLSNNPGLIEAIQRNPTLEDLLLQHPQFAEAVQQNPELLEQASALRDHLGDEIRKLPAVGQKLNELLYICGGAFVENAWDFTTAMSQSAWESARSMYNAAVNGNGDISPLINGEAKEAASTLWNNKDMTTIALKFTAAAIASYKATQFLVLRWRSWSTGYLTKRLTTDNAFARIKDTFTNIDNPGQRIQEDPGHFAGASVSLLTGVTRSAMTLAKFSGLLWGMGPVMGVTGGFFWIGAAYAATLTGLTYGVAHKLPNIYRNKQRVEANLRTATDNLHKNAEQIALTDSAEAERDLVKRRVPPVMSNSMREIGTNVKMIALNATVGNMSIPLPYVVASFAAVAGGTASFGTIQTLNYAFNQVNGSLSFIIDRFEQISSWLATSQRVYALDQAIEAAHYIEEEKRQATAKLNEDLGPIGGGPSGPTGP